MSFKIEATVALPDIQAAIALATEWWNELGVEASFTVSETEGLEPEGVFCESCTGHTIPGVRWPTSPSGLLDNDYVERCDTCCRYKNDSEAQLAVVETYRSTGGTIEIGESRGFLYVNVGAEALRGDD